MRTSMFLMANTRPQKCMSLASIRSYTKRRALLNEQILAIMPTHKSFELLTIVLHIFTWCTKCFEQQNTSNASAKPQKYLLSFELVCYCLAHNQLVHSMFWTRDHIQCSNPQKCVPSFEPLSCTYWAGALIVLNNIPNKATPSGEKSFEAAFYAWWRWIWWKM